MIWKKQTSLDELNRLCQGSAVSHLGITFCAQGEDWLEARLPVCPHTCQPFGLLHGGVSAVLAETLASAAAMLCCEEGKQPVGTELNISHLRGVRSGKALGRAKPLHLGRSSQVWQVEIYNEDHECCAAARVSIALMTAKGQ